MLESILIETRHSKSLLAWVTFAAYKPSPIDTEHLPVVSTGPEGILSPQKDQGTSEKLCKLYLWTAKELCHLQTAYEGTT